MDNCIFCKIIGGKLPSAKVYEDDKVIAFLDIAPNNKGHCLIVPKKHSMSLLDMEKDELDASIRALQKVAIAATRALGCPGFNVVMNNAKEAGQVVFHSHFHLIPRYENDGIKFAARHLSYEGNEKSEYADKIKKFI